MILHFQISEGDSILVAAAQIAAIRKAGNFLAIYLAGGEPVHVLLSDYNCSAVTLWQEYIEGGEK